MSRAARRSGRRLAWGGAWLILAAWLAAVGIGVVSADYMSDPLFSPEVNITKPADNNEVWLAGSDHQVTCDAIEHDQDCNIETGKPERDDLTQWWTAEDGTFKDNECIGPSVVYVCPNDFALETLTAFADDHCELEGHEDDCLQPGGDDYLPEDRPQQSRDLRVVVPDVTEVNFQLESDSYILRDHIGETQVSTSSVAEYVGEIYSAVPIKNHSAVFRKNTPLSLRLKAAAFDNLTEGSSNVTVRFEHGTEPTEQEAEVGSQTFGITWPYESPVMTSTTNFTNCISYEPVAGRATLYSYKVVSGSKVWITFCPGGRQHPLCVVAKQPCLGVGGTKHFEWVVRASCRMTHGQSSGVAKTIVDDIYDSLPDYARVYHEGSAPWHTWKDIWTTELKYHLNTEHTGNVRTLLRYEVGRCGDWCSYLFALCNAQGVTPTDGLKDGFFRITNALDEPLPGQPWTRFIVEHNGTNNVIHPMPPASKDIVDEGEYPNPDGWEIGTYPNKRWWQTPDHGVVFLGNSLYDASFPSTQSKGVTWPGDAGTKSFAKASDFVANYFISCCPYLYGDIEVNLDPWHLWLYVHTDDDDCFPLKLIWNPGPAGEEGLWW